MEQQLHWQQELLDQRASEQQQLQASRLGQQVVRLVAMPDDAPCCCPAWHNFHASLRTAISSCSSHAWHSPLMVNGQDRPRLFCGIGTVVTWVHFHSGGDTVSVVMSGTMQELKASLELNKPGLVTTTELERQLQEARQLAKAQALEAEAQYIAQVILAM